MREKDFFRILVLLSLGISSYGTIITKDGICDTEECKLSSAYHGSCRSIYGENITCYREHVALDKNGFKDCFGSCRENYCHKGGGICSSYSNGSIRDYNFFMINQDGLLYPDSSSSTSSDQLCVESESYYLVCPSTFYKLGTVIISDDGCIDECNYHYYLGVGYTGCTVSWNPEPFVSDCVILLPNYHVFGPVPVVTDGEKLQITEKPYGYFSWKVADIKLQKPKYALDSDCQNGDIVIIRECIRISELKLETNNFKCDTEITPKRIILLAKDEIIIDEDLELGGGINQGLEYPKLSRVILASRKITVCGERKLIVKGVAGIFHEVRPDKAKGQDGPGVVIIGINWKNQRGLSVSTFGGDSACTTQPKFTVDRSFKYPQGFSLSIPFIADYRLKFLVPMTEMSYRFLHYNWFGWYQNKPVFASRFEVVNSLERYPSQEGNPGPIMLLGQDISEPKALLDFHYGVSHDCPHPSEQVSTTFTLFLPVYDDRGSSGWKWVISGSFYDLYEKFKNTVENNGDDDIDILRDWAYTELNEWSDEDSNAVVDYISALKMELGLSSPEELYADLDYLLRNSNNIHPRVAVRALENLQGRIQDSNSVNHNFVKWIYTVTSAHIFRLKTSTRFIIQLDKFVAQKLEIITRLSTFNLRQSRIKEIATEYEMFNNQKIEDAQSLLRTAVLPALEEIRKELGIKLGEVGKEFNATINSRNPNKKRQVDLTSEIFKENFEKAFTTYVTSEVLNVVGSSFQLFLDLFGNVGKTVGGLVNAGPKLPLEIQEKVNNVKIPAGYKLPETIKKSMEPLIAHTQLKLEALEIGIISIIKNLEPDPDTTELKAFFENKLNDLRTETLVKDENELATRTLNDIQAEVEKFREKRLSVSEKTEYIEPYMKGALKLESRKYWYNYLLDGVTYVTDGVSYIFPAAALPSTTATLGIAKTFYPDSDFDKEEQTQHIIESLMAVAAEQARLAMLAQKYDEIFNTFVPMVYDLLQTFNYLTLEFENADSLASLDVTAWKFGTKIRDLRQQLYIVLHDYPSGINVDYLFVKMEYFLDIMYVIFQRIAETKNQKVFAAFLTDIAETNNIDPAVANYVQNLNNSLLQSIILFEVNTAKTAFNQWAFPFASVFLKNLPDYEIEFGSDVDLQSTLDAARNLLEGINNALNDYQYTVVNEVDKLLQIETFERDEDTLSFPFYTWKHEEYKLDIMNLLVGKSIFFTADVQRFREGNQHCDKEVIKFNAIGLNLRNNVYPEKQAQLDQLLRGYRVIMTHLGESYYYFQGKNYMLSGDSITFLRGYSNSDSPTYNLGAKKVSEADPVLSPYTDWNITLQRRDGFAVHPALFRLGLGSDLELVGEGSFLGELAGDKYTDPLVDKFYTAQDNVKPMFKCTGPMSTSRRSLIDVMMSSNDGEIKHY